MVYGQIDPARLEGDALTRWYLRSPDDIEQERQEAAAQRYRNFFRGNAGVDPDPGFEAGLETPTQDVDPGFNGGDEAPAKDVDPEFSWVQVGPNRWRSVSASDDISQAGATFDGAGESDGGESRVAVGNAFHHGPSVAALSAPSSAVSAARATPGAKGPSYGRPLGPLPPPTPSHALVHGTEQTPFGAVADAFHNWQHGPKMQRPNLAESFIPVVGPAWEAAADLQDGNYGGAAFNGVMAVADALPIGVAAKGLKAASKGVTVFKDGSLTARAAASRLRDWGIAKKGEEIHHTVALNGTPRNVQSWKNHYSLLKVLPEETHQRLTRSWNGKPQFDPIRRIWYGTTDWQKAIPTGIAGYAADAWENLTHPFGAPPPNTPGSDGRP